MKTAELVTAARVGVAPSTTTMRLGAAERRRRQALGIQCWPEPEGGASAASSALPSTPKAPAVPGETPKTDDGFVTVMPYAIEPELRSLGIIDPNDYRSSTHTEREGLPGTVTLRIGPHSELGVIDPNDAWQTGQPYRLPGTVAIAYSPRRRRRVRVVEASGAGLGIIANEVQPMINGLGRVPTDLDRTVHRKGMYSQSLCHMPVQTGWIVAEPSEFGQPDAPAPTPADGAVTQLATYQRRQFWLQVISTIAIGSLAAVAVVSALCSRRSG